MFHSVKGKNIPSCLGQRIAGVNCDPSVSLPLLQGDNCAWTPVCSQRPDAGLSPATLEMGENQYSKAVSYSFPFILKIIESFRQKLVKMRGTEITY